MRNLSDKQWWVIWFGIGAVLFIWLDSEYSAVFTRAQNSPDYIRRVQELNRDADRGGAVAAAYASLYSLAFQSAIGKVRSQVRTQGLIATAVVLTGFVVWLLQVRISIGWKIYALTFASFGIWVGFNAPSDRLVAVLILWAFGASAAWFLAPVVSQRGWSVAVRYLAASLVAIGSLAMFIVGVRGVTEPVPRPPGQIVIDRDRVRELRGGSSQEQLRRPVIEFLAAGAVLGIVAVGLWYPRPWRRSADGE
jgi:hypothetical protein